jgi:hypothetical protein
MMTASVATETTERLRLGQVVRRPKNSGSPDAKVQRGVVVFAQGRGWTSEGEKRMHVDDYVVRTSFCTGAIGNADGEWEVVPRDEWTASEAARSTMVLHVYPDWWDEADGPVPDQYLIDYAMLTAMLPADARREVDEGDLPSITELILAVAAQIDLARGIDPDAAGRPWQNLQYAALMAQYG